MRFERKLNKFLWFIFALLPLIVTFLFMFNQSVDFTYNAFISEFLGLFGQGWLYSYLMNFVSLFSIDSVFVTLLVAYVNYLIILQLIKLAYKCVLLIVNICNSLLDNLVGVRNERE